MSDSRLEKFIYAICSMDVSDLPVPLSRIEKLWNCLITGETPDFEPLSRNEKYLMAMLDRYDISNLPAPMSRGEKLLYKIAVGETDLSDVPGYLSRYEELLKYLIENGGISGGDFEYVLYTLNQSLYTLYTTAEKPVKSAILKGNTERINEHGFYQSDNSIFHLGYFEQGTYGGNIGNDNQKIDNATRIRSINSYKVPQGTYSIELNSGFEGIIRGINDYNTVLFSTEWSSSPTTTVTNDTTLLTVILRKQNQASISVNDLEEAYISSSGFDFANITLTNVKMPVLTTTGNNVFDGDNSMELGAWKADSSPVEVSNEIRCKNNFTPFPNGLKNGDVMRIVLSDTSINSSTNMHVYDESKTLIITLGYGTSPYIEGTNFINGVSTITIHDVSKCKYFSFRVVSTNTECKFAIMVNTSAPYEPYKSNILTVNEPIELRGIGDVKDTLDLMTGELTTKTGEMVIDGREEFKWGANWNNYGTAYPLGNPTILDNYNFKKGKNLICEQVPIFDNFGYNDRVGIFPDVNRRGLVLVVPNELTGGPHNVDGLRTWLNENPLTIVYELNQQSIKTVDLTVVDQDNQPTQLGTFENVTHVSLKAENLIPEVEMEVATRISTELASASPLMDDISTKQQQLETTVDEQSENVDATMIATTEIYEETL